MSLDPRRGDRYLHSADYNSTQYHEPDDFLVHPDERPSASDFMAHPHPSSTAVPPPKHKHSIFHRNAVHAAGIGFNPFQGGGSPSEEQWDAAHTQEMSKAERKALKKKKSASFKEIKAEVKIAMGVEELYKEKTRQKKLGGGGASGGGAMEGGIAGLLEKEAEALLGGGGLAGLAGVANKKEDLQRLEGGMMGAGGVAGLGGAMGLGEQFIRKELEQRRERRGSWSRSDSGAGEDDYRGRQRSKSFDRGALEVGGMAILGEAAVAGRNYIRNRQERSQSRGSAFDDRGRRLSVGEEIARIGTDGSAAAKGAAGLGSVDARSGRYLEATSDDEDVSTGRTRKPTIRTLEREVVGATGAAALGGAVGLGSVYAMNKLDRPRTRVGSDTEAESSRELRKPRREKYERVAEELAGAAVVGLGGAYAVEKMERSRRQRAETKGRTERSQTMPIGYDGRGIPVSVPLNARAPLSPSHQDEPKTLLSQLSKVEHFLLQHAAASLLLHEPEFLRVVGSVEGMVRILETRVPSGKDGYTQELFGVSLKLLLKYEATDSHHGAGKGTIKIPTFVDHVITAMMEMDVTVQGILRKSGKMHLVTEIVNALNSCGGDGYVVDLAALDPVTLGTLFKKFLRDLPDPLLTSHLFDLFLAASKIKQPAARKRAMHLVVCMMPRANRDLMEVVFLFLDWLSSYAHITVKIGNEMDLTNIATVMAPTLLRPAGRDPRGFEVSAMIGAVLQLLEDQHILHEIPLELANVLHIEPPATKDSGSLLRKFLKRLP